MRTIIGSIDCETGGLNPLTNSILSFCIVPLNPFTFEPCKDIPILELFMHEPTLTVEPNALRINKLFNYQKHATYKDCFLKFLEYCSKYKITHIEPLGHELDFDFSFMQFWLGPVEMRKIFTRVKRDTRRLAQVLIDAELYGGNTNLGDLCSAFEITIDAHTSIGDATAVSNLYPKMIQRLKGKH